MPNGFTVIRMLFDKRGGGRYDGRQWPAYGELFDVPDWEAQELIAMGDAELASEPKKDFGWGVLKEPRLDWNKPPGEEQDEEPTALSSTDLGDEDADDWDRDDEQGDEDDFGGDAYEPRSLKPAVGDKKAAWIKWAVENGASIDEANGMTKADLIARYGK